MIDVQIYRRLATIDLDVRLSLQPEVLALFGPSGSGKSMTLKIIAGIERADRGTIRSGDRLLYDAESRVNLPPQARHVGYVPQHYALFPHMTALENIAFPLRKGMGWSASRAGERASELLEIFGLTAQAQAKPARLSGGQQQRVSIARALAGEPEILLLDEPFAALDAPTREELREQFRLIQRRLNIPVLLVTHDLEEAATLATRMAVIVDGSIRQVGETRTILDHPADRQVADLVRARNIIPGTAQGDCIQTAIGELPIPSHALLQGTPIHAIIRPEAIEITPDHGIPATVTDTIDHGPRIAVLVTVNGTTLEVSTSPTTARRLGIAAGKQVGLVVQMEDVHVIRGDG